jgi:hypothetical protein
LESQYRHLLTERKTLYPLWNIARELPVIIEIVAEKTSVDLQKLKEVLQQYKVNPNAIYQWNNRYVIFDKVQDVSVLRSKLQKMLPDTKLTVYYDAFYDFNRNHCADTAQAKEWEHIILTANLVNDPKLQREYMDHHATQFQKWPELSKGFCNASFQQLLLYRQGRQLMLVISIPKGTSLDQLNPKTSENNPRVDQWNALMKKYQEGIQGTKKGETWVFLKKLSDQ